MSSNSMLSAARNAANDGVTACRSGIWWQVETGQRFDVSRAGW
jgi:hypothetical protein